VEKEDFVDVVQAALVKYLETGPPITRNYIEENQGEAEPFVGIDGSAGEFFVELLFKGDCRTLLEALDAGAEKGLYKLEETGAVPMYASN
jgi:hypothetical protein